MNGATLELYAPLAESCIDVVLGLHCEVSKLIAEGELKKMSPIRGLLRSNIKVSWRSTTHGDKNCFFFVITIYGAEVFFRPRKDRKVVTVSSGSILVSMSAVLQRVFL